MLYSYSKKCAEKGKYLLIGSPIIFTAIAIALGLIMIDQKADVYVTVLATAFALAIGAHLTYYGYKLSKSKESWIIELDSESLNQYSPECTGDPSFSVAIQDIKSIGRNFRKTRNSKTSKLFYVFNDSGDQFWLGGNSGLPVRELCRVINNHFDHINIDL